MPQICVQESGRIDSNLLPQCDIYILFALPTDIIRYIFKWLSFTEIMRFDSAVMNHTLRNEWSSFLPMLMTFHGRHCCTNPHKRNDPGCINEFDIVSDEYLCTMTNRKTGPFTGTVKVWDYQQQVIKFTYENVYRAIPIIESNQILILYENRAVIYDLETGECLFVSDKRGIIEVIVITSQLFVFLVYHERTKQYSIYLWDLSNKGKLNLRVTELTNTEEIYKMSNEVIAVRDSDNIWRAFYINGSSFPHSGGYKGYFEFDVMKSGNHSLVLFKGVFRRVWDPIRGIVSSGGSPLSHAKAGNEFQLQLKDQRVVYFNFRTNNLIVTRSVMDFWSSISFPYPWKNVEFTSFIELSSNCLVSIWSERRMIFLWHLDTKTVEPIKATVPVQRCVRVSDNSFMTSCETENYLTLWTRSM